MIIILYLYNFFIMKLDEILNSNNSFNHFLKNSLIFQIMLKI